MTLPVDVLYSSPHHPDILTFFFLSLAQKSSYVTHTEGNPNNKQYIGANECFSLWALQK